MRSEKPSSFRFACSALFALGFYCGGTFGLIHWIFIEYSLLYILIYSFHVVHAMYRTVIATKEYRRVLLHRKRRQFEESSPLAQ